MVTRRRRRFLRTKRQLLILLAVILAVIGVWALKSNDQSKKSDTSDSGSYINLNPPTEEEKQGAEAQKDKLTQPSTTPSSSTTGKKQVTPIITNADQNEVNAYVPGVFEDGGTCSATLTKGSQAVKKSSTGFKNVSYTTCTPINLSGSLTEKGTWSLVLSYSSASAEGKSAATSVEVR